MVAEPTTRHLNTTASDEPVQVARAAMLEERLQNLKKALDREPNNPAIIEGLGTTYRLLRRFEEADELLARGASGFTSSSEIAIAYARVASDRGQFPEAVRRWRLARQHFSGIPSIEAGLASALQSLNQLDEAEEIIGKAQAKFPDDGEVAMAFARMATLRFDWPKALERWRVVLGQQPSNATPYVGVGVALRELMRFEEADQVLLAALEKFPHQQNVVVNYAWTATRKRDWQEALRRWERVRELFGEIFVYVRGRGLVLTAAKIDEIDASLAADVVTTNRQEAVSTSVPREARLQALPLPDEDFRLLLERFQSLGEDCEFGFVQRHGNAEPLSLLRWANTRPQHLVELLRTRFAGVGDEENTEVFKEIDGELWVRDLRYGLRTHTFVYEGQLPEERRGRFKQQMLKRSRFLKDKQLEDLDNGAKIFVVKSPDGISDECARSIYDAIGAYGENWLLCVRHSDTTHSAGAVSRVHERLMIGYVSRIAGIDHVGWLSVLQKSFALYSLHAGTPS